MKKASIEIDGLKDVQLILKKLTPRHAQNIMRATVLEMAKKERDMMRENAPTDGAPAELRAAIKHRRKRARPGQASAVVTIDKSAFYWFFLEYGTVHIRARSFVSRAKEQFRSQLMPFYLHAFARKLEAAVQREQRRRAK